MSFDEHGDIYAYLISINGYKTTDARDVVAYLILIAFRFATVATNNHEVLNCQSIICSTCGHLCCTGISFR